MDFWRIFENSTFSALRQPFTTMFQAAERAVNRVIVGCEFDLDNHFDARPL